HPGLGQGTGEAAAGETAGDAGGQLGSHIGAVDAQRHVRPVADLAGPGGAGGQGGGEAQAVQADVFRVLQVVLAATQQDRLGQGAAEGGQRGGDVLGAGVLEHRVGCTAVVVHE